MLNSLHTLTRCILNHHHRVISSTPARSASELNGSLEPLEEEEERPDTPLIASEVEPCTSSGRGRSDLCMRRSGVRLAGGNKSEMELLNESTVDFRQQLVEAEDE